MGGGVDDGASSGANGGDGSSASSGVNVSNGAGRDVDSDRAPRIKLFSSLFTLSRD